MKKHFLIISKVILATFFGSLIACPVPPEPEPTPGGEKPSQSSKVLKVTSKLGAALLAKDHKDKGYTGIEFEDGHKVKTIGAGAFVGNKIKALVLPDVITAVGKSAFQGNPLETLTIGKGVATIGAGAFQTSSETLNVTLRRVIGTDTDEKLANVFGRKVTLKFKTDTTLASVEKTAVDTLVAKANIEAPKAKNLKQVTFDSNKGTLVPKAYVASGGAISKPTDPIKAGYALEGWYTKKDLTGTKFDFATTINKDITLYAKWVQAPTVTTVAFHNTPTGGQDDKYKIGDNIDVVVTFSEAVETVTTDGTPKIVVKFDSGDKDFVYSGGATSSIGDTTKTKLVFRYTVAVDDNDPDGIEIDANKLSLEGGTIQKEGTDINALLTHDAVSADASHKVDGVAPTVSSVVFGPAPTGGQDDKYKIGDNIHVVVAFSEAVAVTGTPKIVVKLASDKDALYHAAETGALRDATKLVFRYTVVAGDNDPDGIEIDANKLSLEGGTIKDTAGNAVNLNHDPVAVDASRKVDGVKPTVSSVVFHTPAPQNAGGYRADEKITVRVTFSEAVLVTGTPQITVKLSGDASDGDSGASDREAQYVSGSDSTVLTFEYTVVTDDEDSTGIEINANALANNGGSTIKDKAGNEPANLNHIAVPVDVSKKVDGDGSA